MMMLTKISTAIAGVMLVASPMVTGDGFARDRRDEQDAARKAMLEGQVMPFSVIKRRVEHRMGDATYLGSEFHKGRNQYRLKYVRDGRVVWIDVDGRTGEVAGMAD